MSLIDFTPSAHFQHNLNLLPQICERTAGKSMGFESNDSIRRRGIERLVYVLNRPNSGLDHKVKVPSLRCDVVTGATPTTLNDWRIEGMYENGIARSMIFGGNQELYSKPSVRGDIAGFTD